MVSQFRIDLYINPLNFKVPQRSKNPVQRIHRMVSAPRVHPQPTQAALLLAGGATLPWREKFGLAKIGNFKIIFILFYSPHTLLHTHALILFFCAGPMLGVRRERRGRCPAGVRGSPAAGQPRPLPVPGGPAPSAGHPPQWHGAGDAGSSPGSAAPRGSPAQLTSASRIININHRAATRGTALNPHL